jgi:16S rRNA processing protein RimM
MSGAHSPLLLEVGRIAKPHGLKGEVIVRLTTNRTERLAPGTVLETDHGPLTVERSAAHQDRWRVLFAGFTDRTGAESLHGRVLRAEAIHDPEALWIHELIGATVVEAEGTEPGVVRGVVTSVEANPSGDLLVLDTGHLVPLRFVVNRSEGRDRADRLLVVEVPEGLFDLLDN